MGPRLTGALDAVLVFPWPRDASRLRLGLIEEAHDVDGGTVGKRRAGGNVGSTAAR